MGYEEKTALVTGAGAGIGRAVCRRLCQSGLGRLIALDCSSDALHSLEQELEGFAQTEIIGLRADISNRAELETVLGSMIQEACPLDYLINSAGISDDNLVEDEERWERILSINLQGHYQVTRIVLKHLRRNGRIVNVSSVLGRVGKIRNTAYCTSKHALLGFTKSLALDLAARKITVNAVLPAWVDTPMLRRELQLQADLLGLPVEQIIRNAGRTIPIKRLIEADEVAAAILFFISEAAGAITAQSLMIDGGMTCGA